MIGVFFGLGLAPLILVAQSLNVDLKAEEAAIRAPIAESDEIGARSPSTEDRILWNGAHKRPIVGSESGELCSEAEAAMRINAKNTEKVERIEVAASGDMAWVFSYVTRQYDRQGDPSFHYKGEAASLTVWKKVNGQWKWAARFQRPLDVPFAPLETKKSQLGYRSGTMPRNATAE